ncbi:MAG: TIGR04053 family radical SAM/SPASM domain-containing protein [Planctomycetales bacterium]|nr:TIGR04053 family radical SAM/SPASM domain-containing protein [Planctomycetales bacterium]
MPAPPRAARYSRLDLGHSPLIVFWETTQACDLACLHCRARALPLALPGELNASQALALVDQLCEFPRPPMLVLTGGDPLKRPDIFDVVSYASQRGLEVSITPSATPLVTFDALRKLHDCGIARVAVSLDGVDAATHDAFRGVAGSFDRTLNIIAGAAALGLPVQVNTTVVPANFHQIDAIADLLADKNVTLWSVFFLVPVGRADAVARLSAQQYEQAFERLWRNSLRQPYMIKTTEAPHYRRFCALAERPKPAASTDRPRPPQGFSMLGVNDGKGVMFIGHTGMIYPSGFMPIQCGVFPQQHIVDVYQRSPLMEALRDEDRLEGKCGRCEFRRVCGGSRARAYAVTGNPLAEEPDCLYQPTGSVGQFN